MTRAELAESAQEWVQRQLGDYTSTLTVEIHTSGGGATVAVEKALPESTPGKTARKDGGKAKASVEDGSQK